MVIEDQFVQAEAEDTGPRPRLEHGRRADIGPVHGVRGGPEHLELPAAALRDGGQMGGEVGLVAQRLPGSGDGQGARAADHQQPDVAVRQAFQQGGGDLGQFVFAARDRAGGADHDIASGTGLLDLDRVGGVGGPHFGLLGQVPQPIRVARDGAHPVAPAQRLGHDPAPAVSAGSENCDLHDVSLLRKGFGSGRGADGGLRRVGLGFGGLERGSDLAEQGATQGDHHAEDLQRGQ